MINSFVSFHFPYLPHYSFIFKYYCDGKITSYSGVEIKSYLVSTNTLAVSFSVRETSTTWPASVI